MEVHEDGPWAVDNWSNGKIVLQSQDLKHDVALEISGDFASEEQMRAYAEEIARRLNCWNEEHFPPAVSVEYDTELSRLAITLDNGLIFTVPPSSIKGIEKARIEDLLAPEISPSGDGIHFPTIDVDLYIPAMFTKSGSGKHIGSSFDGFLSEEGILEETTAAARNRCVIHANKKMEQSQNDLLESVRSNAELVGEREAGWYFVRNENWDGGHGEWTPALWKPECKAWYSYQFSGIPDRQVIVGDKIITTNG